MSPNVRKCNAKTIVQLFALSQSEKLSWQSFRKILASSALKYRLHGDFEQYPALQACRYLSKLCYKNLHPNEMAALQTLACILYLLPHNDVDMRKASTVLLRTTFEIRVPLEPMLVHYFTNNLLNHFKLDRIGVGFVLTIATFVCRTNAMGQAVAVCLLWSIIFRCADSKAIIHQYRDLNELSNILFNVSLDRISMDVCCFLLHAVGCLLHLMLCNKWQAEFVAYGYPLNYFRLLPQNRRKLREWVKHTMKYYDDPTKSIVHRSRSEALKVLASLNYLEANAVEWCLICRSGVTDNVCMLGQIIKVYDC